MHLPRVKVVLATTLAGVLLTVASPAIARAQPTDSSDPTPSNSLDEFYVLQNLKSGKVLQAVSSANGAKVVQQPKETGEDLQHWFLILDGSYNSFENFASGLNLGIDRASTAAGAAAITANRSGDLNQDWMRVGSAYSGDYFALKNRKSGLCLGISGASTANGAQAAQFTCDGSANQGWLLTH